MEEDKEEESEEEESDQDKKKKAPAKPVAGFAKTTMSLSSANSDKTKSGGLFGAKDPPKKPTIEESDEEESEESP